MFLSIPEFAMAEGNLHIGALELHPYLTLKETYSDNIYSTATEEKHDYITTIIPGMRLQFPFRAHQLALEYNVVLNEYKKYDEENITNHNANALLDFKFGRRLGLKLSDVYARGHEPRGSSSTGLIEKYKTNAAAASATYQMADVSMVQLDYAKTTYNFITSQFRDRDEDLISAYIYYRFLPKTSVFLEYDYKSVNFDPISDDLDNKVDSGFLGLTWEITEKSKGTIKGGYLWKDFDVQSGGDLETWTASIDLDHRFTDYTSIRLIGQRMVNESNLQGTKYIITTGAYAEFTHRFIAKLAAIVRGSYGKDDFSDVVPPETRVRKDRTAVAGIGLKYFIQNWLAIAVDYNHRDRNSNINVNDYTENSYTFTINFAL
ncbi:MAG: outer membrane beta-barrel protein [Deltaproteobacteria bacterium]|nr:outer membrane beta-barrel protein [Deltaproteobacteria bacterium]